MEQPATGRMRLWERLVEAVDGGKRVGEAHYQHVSALSAAACALLDDIVRSFGDVTGEYNVIKLNMVHPRLSLLHYPRFEDDGFPLLRASCTLDLATGEVDRRGYAAEGNPPVLHRKELLVADDHPRRQEFAAITESAVRHGLFADTAIIGHQLQWDEELRARGLLVDGHRLVAGSSAVDVPTESVYRHRTALSRRKLSTPMQALWRHGYLTPEATVLDYGCGRGDDIAALRASGLVAEGWDPYFRSEGTRVESDIVNLGFVLNVIEDLRERREALSAAFGYARRVLAVAALIGGRTAYERYRLFQDGVLTSRGTFQKYFTHEELGGYIAEILRRDPVSVGPGLYFVFRSDEDEQDYLERRQRSHTRVATLLPSPPKREVERAPIERPVRTRPPREERAPRPAKPPKVPKPTKWEQHADLIDAYWRNCLSLGRPPRSGEFGRLGELSEAVGSPSSVLRKLLERHGSQLFERARQRRRGDLSVFLALNLFERRRSASRWSERIRTDVRELWGGSAQALEDAKALLFSLGDATMIGRCCEEAASSGIGCLAPGDSLHLDARLMNELPAPLRAYVGCAGKLYGEAGDADVVKIHIASGKVSLMTYDDYDGAAVPMLIERVKIELRRQYVHYYQYGQDFPAQPLYFKSRYMHPSLEGYEAQCAFDARLEAIGGVDWSGFGPPLQDVLPLVREIPVPDGMTLTGPSAPPPMP